MLWELAKHVKHWLEDSEGPAVVGLNEINPVLAGKLEQKLRSADFNLDIGRVTRKSNTLLTMWCAAFFFGPALPACLAWCWCLDAQRAVARLQNTHNHTHTHSHAHIVNTCY